MVAIAICSDFTVYYILNTTTKQPITCINLRIPAQRAPVSTSRSRFSQRARVWKALNLRRLAPDAHVNAHRLKKTHKSLAFDAHPLRDAHELAPQSRTHLILNAAAAVVVSCVVCEIARVHRTISLRVAAFVCYVCVRVKRVDPIFLHATSKSIGFLLGKPQKSPSYCAGHFIYHGPRCFDSFSFSTVGCSDLLACACARFVLPDILLSV